MKKYLITANWKMHGDLMMAENFFADIKSKQFSDNVEVAILPPFLFIPAARKILKDSTIHYGVQNINQHEQGAFTGEISVKMLGAFDCRYVLIGHSERRQYFGETNQLVAEKIKLAQAQGYVPIVCVGETLEQYEAGQTEVSIATQLLAISESVNLQRLVIAYEPVWAIGTGKTPSVIEIAEVHDFIKDFLISKQPALAAHLQILYGGSVKADNAREIFQIPAVDGALVGGASLKIDSFLEIIRACNN